MAELVLKMSVTVDGFVGGPNGEIDWIFQTMDDAATRWTVDNVWQAGFHAMGTRTFRDMASFWPTSTEVFAAPMNAIPKIVFTRNPARAPDAGETTTALAGATRRREARGEPTLPADPDTLKTWLQPVVANGADLTAEIARLKREASKDIIAHGGASFARSLVSLDLVDEYRLLVHPIALGHGLALFGALERPRNLKLVEVKPFPGGAAAHIYRKG